MEIADWVCPVVHVALGSGDGWWEEKPIGGTRNRPVTGGHHNWAKAGTKAGSELWILRCCSMIPRSPRSKRTRRRATCERSDATKAGFERQGTVTTPDGPAVYMVQTRGHSSNTQCYLTLPSRGRPRAGALITHHQNVKHHEGSGDRRKYRLNYQR